MTLTPQLAQQCLEALEAEHSAIYGNEKTRAAISALREALASGEGDEARDAARLDWMIFHSARVKHTSDAEYCVVEWSDEDLSSTTKPFGNAREAIDAAMKGNGNAG